MDSLDKAEPIEKVAANFDHFDAESVTCPWARWARLREEAPIAWSEKNGGYWVLTRYAEVCEALRDTETFSNHLKGVQIPSKPVPHLPPSEFDGHEHSAYRHVVNPLLAPEKVEQHQSRIEEIVRRHVEPALASAAFDVGNDVAVPITQDVTQLVLGMEDAPADMKQCAEDLAHMKPNAEEAGKRLFEIVTAEVTRRRASPGDDAISTLLKTKFDDTRLLTDDEIVRMTVLLILAGLDTTTSAITGSTWYLVQNSQALQQLATADERLWRLALDELVRWTGPTTGSARTVTRDVDFHGVRMRAGDRVMPLTASGNRDPSAFTEHPDDVRLDRFPNRHLGFGMGPHRCVGSHLAKAVLKTTLQALVKGLGEFRLKDPRLVAWEGGTVRGIRSLPLVRK